MSGHMNHAGAWSKRALGGLMEFVWPSRSLVSGRRDFGAGAAPPDDWARLVFIEDPVCRRCGRPEPIDLKEETLCAACQARPPKWTRGRAALVYDDASKKSVLDLKHAGRRDGLVQLGRWMSRAGRTLIEDADLLAPVPLHYRRLAVRGHNQSLWLAAEISRQTGAPLLRDAVRRRKATPSQGGLSAKARRRNMSGAFDVTPARAKRIAGRRVLLIDDVLTTGATLSACASALKRAGAADVDALVLARVVRETDVTI